MQSYLEQDGWTTAYTSSYRDLVHSGCTGKKVFRQGLNFWICRLNFKTRRKKEGEKVERDGGREGKREEGRERRLNIFPAHLF